MRGNTLFVQGLSPLTRAKDLAKEFQKVGILTRCDIPMSKGISKRYGFVEFREEVAANEAIRIFMNTRVDGHLISVEVCHYNKVVEVLMLCIACESYPKL